MRRTKSGPALFEVLTSGQETTSDTLKTPEWWSARGGEQGSREQALGEKRLAAAPPTRGRGGEASGGSASGGGAASSSASAGGEESANAPMSSSSPPHAVKPSASSAAYRVPENRFICPPKIN